MTLEAAVTKLMNLMAEYGNACLARIDEKLAFYNVQMKAFFLYTLYIKWSRRNITVTEKIHWQ